MKHKKVFRQVVFIVFLSTVLGLCLNFSLINRYFQAEFTQNFLSAEEYPSITFIDIFEAKEYFAYGEADIIDNREEKKLEMVN